LIALTDAHPALKRFFEGNVVNTSFTLGYFAYNPSYAARPDNTGRALLRYAGHLDMFIPETYLGVYVDTTFFTDRHADSKARPSELDLTVGIAARFAPFEVSVAFERDMPLDEGDLVQQMLFLYASWSFSAFSNQAAPSPKPVTNQGGVLGSRGAPARF
jgi:hypothetical protein